jgi:hypothetical protein
MATGNVIVSVVDVGIGQCNFVEIYDDSIAPVLTNTLLIDCGTLGRSPATYNNLQYIVNCVSSMVTPCFDCVIFSHSDRDHISLMKRLLLMFAEQGRTKPTITKLWYGGNYTNYTKGSSNILTWLVNNNYCQRQNVVGFTSNYTDYSPYTHSFAGSGLWQNNNADVGLYMMAGNVMSANPEWNDLENIPVLNDDIELNRVSLVCCLRYMGASYVICGDATNDTMAAINVRFNAPTSVFDNNIMTTLPHHGSRRTGLSVANGSRANNVNINIVRTFAALVNSLTVTASSFEKLTSTRTFGHPSLDFSTYFNPNTRTFIYDPRLDIDTILDLHLCSMNNDITLLAEREVEDDDEPILRKRTRPEEYTLGDGIVSFVTDANVFTTQYFSNFYDDKTFYFDFEEGQTQPVFMYDIPPTLFNPHASWKYTTAASGAFTIAGFADLLTPLSFTAQYNDGVAKAQKRAKSLEQLLPAAAPGFQIRKKNKSSLTAQAAPNTTNLSFHSYP